MGGPLRISLPPAPSDSGLRSSSSGGSSAGSLPGSSPFAQHGGSAFSPLTPPSSVSPPAYRGLVPLDGDKEDDPAPANSPNDIFSQNWRMSAPYVRPSLLPAEAARHRTGPRTASGQSSSSFKLVVPSLPQSQAPPHDVFNATLDETPRATQGMLPAASTSEPIGESQRLPPAVAPPSASVLLRLYPTRRYLLGEGIHAAVYLAAFKWPGPGAAEGRWRLCAAKRPGPDSADNAANLREAAILRRLGAYNGGSRDDGRRGASRRCPWIVGLHAVKDERDLTERPAPAGGGASVEASSSTATTPGVLAHSHHRTTKSIDSGPLSRSGSTAQGLDVATGIIPPPIAVLDPSYFPDPSSTRPFMRRGSSQVEMQERHEDDRTPFAFPLAAQTEVIVDPPRLVLLLEYCPGGTLFDFVRSSPDRVGRGRWSSWARQLSTAVAWCTRHGVVIGDLKPQNVMLAEDLTLRLADFNRSIIVSPALPPPTDPLGIGTSAYSPPELVRSAPSRFGFPADVFSLGVTLCVALTGREPFQSVRSPVERMMWVLRGGFWEWEERQRYDRDAGSQPPSRAGSVRRSGAAGSGTPQTGRRERQSSTGSRVSEIAVGVSGLAASSASPTHLSRSPLETHLLSERLLDASGARGQTRIGQHAIDKLLRDGDAVEDDHGSVDVSRRSSIASAGSRSARTSLDYHQQSVGGPVGHDDPDTAPPDGEDVPLTARYSDGTPLQWYLDERHVVSEGVRWLLKRMCDPDAAHRPTIGEVLDTLGILFPGAQV